MRKQDDSFILMVYKTYCEVMPEFVADMSFEKFKLLYIQRCKETI